MASVPSKLAGYIVKEITAEFEITNSQTLSQMAAAISQAIDTYITTDVETKQGQQVQVSLADGKGQTIAPGDLF
jgi:hypothetical protein